MVGYNVIHTIPPITISENSMSKIHNAAPIDATHFSNYTSLEGVIFYKDLDTDTPMFSHINYSWEWCETNNEIFTENRIYDLKFRKLINDVTIEYWDGVGKPKIGEHFYWDTNKVIMVGIFGSNLLVVDYDGAPDLITGYQIERIIPAVESFSDEFNVDYDTATAILEAGYHR